MTPEMIAALALHDILSGKREVRIKAHSDREAKAIFDAVRLQYEMIFGKDRSEK